MPRPFSVFLDSILDGENEIKCLDHGFVRVVDYMGNQDSVLQAARVSYNQKTKKSTDVGLLRYLLRNQHTSPFEMCELKLHVKLPIFVARQWIRTRMASTNENSARYSVLDKEFYIPAAENLAVQSTDNKQGRGEPLTPEQAAFIQNLLRKDCENAYTHYEQMLNEYGLARELARMDLPVNFYTQWYWKIDLHNLLRFLSLRLHHHAQYEIRVYADAIAGLVKGWVPDIWEAFEDYTLDAVKLSGKQHRVILAALRGEEVTYRTHGDGMSTREWAELESQFGVLAGL